MQFLQNIDDAVCLKKGIARARSNQGGRSLLRNRIGDPLGLCRRRLLGGPTKPLTVTVEQQNIIFEEPAT